jgi:hypothetical protein
MSEEYSTCPSCGSGEGQGHYADCPETLKAENARLTARVKELEGALREAFEVYAGSDGFIPETCAEGYQQQIIRQMVDCISGAIPPPPTIK